MKSSSPAMTAFTTTEANCDASATARGPRFCVELLHDWKQATARWSDANPSTPFQDVQWLDAWYRAFAGLDRVDPLIAVITDHAKGECAAWLPLVRRLQNGIRIIEFADLDLTDYNAPLLGPAAPHDGEGAATLWHDLKVALRRVPGGADLIRLRKMPVDLAGRPNPLALLEAATRCLLNGNIVTTGEDYDAWRFTLERTVRKELERSWRVFTRDPTAEFRIVTDRSEALRVLAVTDAQQGARMQQLEQNFILNNDACAAFYRYLVDDGIDSGFTVVSALTVGEEVVATLLGIRRGTRYTMVRISNAGEKWSNCSPGRLIIERSMAALHRDGVREVDFSIGNYSYKRRFGVTRVPLVDITAALGWRGLPYALRERAVQALHRHPPIETFLKRVLGKAQSRHED